MIVISTILEYVISIPNNIIKTLSKAIEFIGGIKPMVKYRINLNFKENGKSVNEIITEVLKIELEKNINTTCNILKNEEPFNSAYYSQNERNSN